MSNKTRLALFDLDHTLLPIDSDFAWGEFTQAIGWTDPVLFKHRNEAFYRSYQEGTLDVHAYVRFATEAIKARGEAEALAARARFMSEVVAPVVHERALQLVRGHQDAGDSVAIVTATNEFVTRPIADMFGVADLIAVELDRDADGWISGGIRGVPSFRDGKIVRVEQWLAGRGMTLGGVESTFYSDSINDLPLLERVDHPVATQPDAKLAAIAKARGWRILNLFDEKK